MFFICDEHIWEVLDVFTAIENIHREVLGVFTAIENIQFRKMYL